MPAVYAHPVTDGQRCGAGSSNPASRVSTLRLKEVRSLSEVTPGSGRTSI